jgi:RND family efflux transporter MFP subunit
MAACLAAAAGQTTSQPAGIEAVTRPSEDVTLSFLRPGQVARVLVGDGQQVEPNQLLVCLDDKAEAAQIEQLKAQAMDTVRIRAAESQLAQKTVDLKKLQEAATRGATTPLEVEHASLEVTIAQLSLELAKFEQQQSRRKYDEALVHIQRMNLTSPLAGRVEKVHVQVGQSVDALKEVVRVVKTDPLWADVPVPTAIAEGFSLNQQVVVGPVRGAWAPVTGRVIHKASVADAASDTLLVRVELPNRTGLPAGQHVRVELASPVQPSPAAPAPAPMPAQCAKQE